MLYLLKKIALLFLIVGILYIPIGLYVESCYPDFGSIDYPLWEHVFNFAEKVSYDNPDVVFLGDSRVLAGIYPRAISPTAFSFSLTATAPFSNYFLLRKFLHNHKPPRVVVIAFAPENLYQAAMDRGITHRYLDMSESLDVITESVILGDKPWYYPDARKFSVDMIVKDYVDLFLYKIYYPPYYHRFYRNEIHKCREFNQHHLRGQRKSRGYIHFGMANGTSKSNRAARELETEYSPLVLHYVDKILSMCRERKIAVIMTTMPFSESSYGRLSSEYIDSYAAVLGEFKSKYPEFHIETKINTLPDKYFGDSSHVNLEGTKLVTGGLRQALVQKGFIKP